MARIFFCCGTARCRFTCRHAHRWHRRCKGHDLIRLRAAHPKIQRKLIVQDVPAVVSGIAPNSLPRGIEAQANDLFEPKSMHRSRPYFLAESLHDWPDKQASIILKKIKNAMGKDSILLRNENLMQEENVPFESGCTDWMLMAAFSAMERKERQFKELIENVILVLRKVWGPPNVVNGTLEVARK